MGRKYTWAFIDTNTAATATSAEGQKGSVQFNDPDDEGTFTGSTKLIFDETNEDLLLTGSLTGSGDAVFANLHATSDIYAAGDVYAQNYIVQNVSIIDATGSTNFGDSTGDFHEFTGSLRVSGDGPHRIDSGLLHVTVDANFNGDTQLGNTSADSLTINALARIGEHTSPSAPSDGQGGYLYSKSDGKPYWISNELTETDLSEALDTSADYTLTGEWSFEPGAAHCPVTIDQTYTGQNGLAVNFDYSNGNQTVPLVHFSGSSTTQPAFKVTPGAVAAGNGVIIDGRNVTGAGHGGDNGAILKVSTFSTNQMTDGRVCLFQDKSSDSSTREVVHIHQDGTGGTGCVGLRVEKDADGCIARFQHGSTGIMKVHSGATYEGVIIGAIAESTEPRVNGLEVLDPDSPRVRIADSSGNADAAVEFAASTTVKGMVGTDSLSGENVFMCAGTSLDAANGIAIETLNSIGKTGIGRRPNTGYQLIVTGTPTPPGNSSPSSASPAAIGISGDGTAAQIAEIGHKRYESEDYLFTRRMFIQQKASEGSSAPALVLSGSTGGLNSPELKMVSDDGSSSDGALLHLVKKDTAAFSGNNLGSIKWSFSNDLSDASTPKQMALIKIEPVQTLDYAADRLGTKMEITINQEDSAASNPVAVFNEGGNGHFFGTDDYAPFSAASVGTHFVSERSGYVAAFVNDGNSSSNGGIKIKCGSDAGGGGVTAVMFHDGDGTEAGKITFTGWTVTYGNFTGNHPMTMEDRETRTYQYGEIVKVLSTQYVENSHKVDYIAQVTTTANDPSAIGVYAISPASDGENVDTDESLIYSLGDGHILVCSEGGDIAIGDYISSSNTEGHGMKQSDDLLHSYTVAKATEAVNWAEESGTTKLISCTYHAG